MHGGFGPAGAAADATRRVFVGAEEDVGAVVVGRDDFGAGAASPGPVETEAMLECWIGEE